MAQNPSNVIPDQLIVVEGDAGFVPKAEPSDAGKVLGVLNSDGDIGWTEDREGMAQQQADWAETDPSKVTYIAHKPSGQMAPASTSSDSGKVLKVDSQGAPVWGDAPAGIVEFDWSTVTLSDIEGAITAGKTPVMLYVPWDNAYTTKCSLQKIEHTGSGDNYVFVSTPEGYVNTPSDQSTSITRLIMMYDGSKGSDIRRVSANLSSSDGSVTMAQGATSAYLDLSVANPLPASTSADADKVLTVNSSGTPEWATAQGGGGGGVTPPTPTTENYGFTYASIQGFRQGSPTVITDWAPASFTLFSPFWNSSAGEPRYYTDWWAEFPNHLRNLLGDINSYVPLWGEMFNQAWADSGANPWPSLGNRFSADVTLKFPLSIDTSVFTTVLDIDCNITARGADPMGMGSGPEIILYNAYPRLKLARGEAGYQYFFHQMHIPMCVNNRPISEIGNITYEISVPQGTTMSVPAASQYSQEDLNDFGIYATFHPETSFQTVYS